MATVNGTSGNDNLIGTPKGDSISGALGDDILSGGGSKDKFIFHDIIDTVKSSTDTFVYSTDGFDIIKDFSLSEDDSIINVSQGKSYPYYLSIGISALANANSFAFGSVANANSIALTQEPNADLVAFVPSNETLDGGQGVTIHIPPSILIKKQQE
jgi:hypothetical protein